MVTMSLYPTKTRVQLLRDVDAGLVMNDIRNQVIDGRVVLIAPKDGFEQTVTARIAELEKAGWAEEDEDGINWRLTAAGLAVAYPASERAPAIDTPARFFARTGDPGIPQHPEVSDG